MKIMHVLAIDLGTQSMRAALMDINGNILDMEQVEHQVHVPHPGWAQQQPRVWWDLTKQVIKTLSHRNKSNFDTVEAISTCGQMHGPVGIDRFGEITTEWTQIWMDKRSETICQAIREQYDETELLKITANPITTGWPGVKVRWIKEHERAVYDKTECFLVPKDFINYKLTGNFATDHSEASGTYLYDAAMEDYSKTMAEILDVSLSKFAPIKNAFESVGHVKPDVARDLGLSTDIPVMAGGGDFIVSLLGLGLIDESTAVDMTGTSTLFVVHKNNPIINSSIQNLKHVISGWVPFAMLDCGGLSMKWCKELLSSNGKGDLSYKEMISLASQIPIGSEGLSFYPYLLGERRKENSLARGAFLGITLNHKAGHFSRSVMEGVTLATGSYANMFKSLGVDLKRVCCVGGATRNKLLYQMKADIMNMPQLLTNQPESSLKGCALLASYGLGYIKDFAGILEDRESNFETINPIQTNVVKYNLLLDDFKKMYNYMMGFWQLAHSLQ
jgi:xylulokinase